MKNKKNKVLIIIILLLFLLGIGGYFIYDMVFVNFNNNDTFSMDTNSGRVIVTGYVTSEIIQENLYDVGYEYIYFNILKSNSQNFLTYIENSKGNTFVSDRAIGIGCVENESLGYVNNSDEYGMKGYNLSKEDTTKIMNATKENPITLKLERLELTSPGDAPSCYSHITTIKVVD